MPAKYKKIFLLPFFIFLSWYSYSQKLAYFQTLLKPTGNQAQQGCSILQLADRGFILGGAYDIHGDYPKILVIRTDSLGRVLWTKTYGGDNDKNLFGYYDFDGEESAVNMIFAPDSNIMICTSTLSYGSATASFYLLKIDKNGKTLWGRAIGANNISIGYALVNAPGGGFVMVGYTTQCCLSDSGHVMLIKTNDTGEVVWAKIYGGFGVEYGFCISTTKDGGYLVGGTAENRKLSYGEDDFILKVDRDGNLLWTKVYGTQATEFIASVMELPDHSIYAFSYGDKDYTTAGTTQLIKLDSNGNFLWSQNYGNAIGIGTGTGYPSAMYYDPVSKLINMSAFLPDPTVYWGLFHLKTDTSGNVKSFKEYSDDINVATGAGTSMGAISGGGCVLISSSYSVVSNTPWDIYFVKVDSSGSSNLCNVPNRIVKKTAYPMADHSYNFTTTVKTPVVVSGYASSNLVMSDTSYCAPFFTNFRYRNDCSDTVFFYDSTYEYPTFWEWDFGEPNSPSNTSSLKNPVHIYTKSGTYTIRLIAGNGTVTDTAIKKINIGSPIPFKFDTLICGGSAVTLRASGGATYKWSPANSVSNTTSATPTTTPKRTTNFIVEAISAQGCATYDTVHVAVDNKPAAPQIDYATVKTNTEIDVKFQRSDSNDVSVYEVFKSVNGGAFSLLQTINNLSNTDSIYVIKDLAVNTATNKYAYKILAVDSCGAVGDTSTAHQTMVLAVKQLGCTQTLQINWNPYIGWAAVKNYEVFRSTNGGTDSLIGNVTNTVTTYNDTGLNHNNLYCYKVLALDKADSFVSQSNTVCKQTFFPDTPQVLSASKISTSTTNGTVVIRWNSINKANLAYNELFFSRDGVNFSQIGGHFLPGVDSFAQTGLDTKDSDYYYYLVTVDSCGAQSIKSPTSKTMTLTVTVGELLHKLNWTPYLGFKIKEYYIERFQKGQFVTIDSVPGVDTFSREFPAPCNYAIRYRIAAIGYDSGEVAWSDTMGRQAIDTIPSDPPVMLNATVLNGASSKINFVGSDSLDTYEFAIQRSTDGNWGTAGAILFTKPGDSLQFIDTGINTVKNHYCYTVIALDSCLNASESDTFCLINLQGKGVQLSDSLNWYPFVGYDLNNYAVLTLNPSGIWDTLTAVNANDTSFYNANLKCNQTITYKIAGKEQSGTRLTFSDSVTLTPFDTIKPPVPALYYATVLPNQTVKLGWQWNPTSIVKYFEIWRSTNHKSPVLIDSVTDDSIFIDKNANVKDSLYSYSVIAIDSCNTTNRSKPSQTDSIMLLSLYSLYCSPQVQVHWTAFTGLPNGVSSYNVLRSTDGVNFTSIGSVNASATMFVDNSVTIGQQYYYKTEAVESKSGYVSYSDTLGIIPSLIPLADSAQLVYATVLKSDETHGEIYIQWKRAALNDTNARGYYVYSYNTANGKYALLQNITNLNDTSIIQENINTIQDAYKYYIVTYNVCDVGINSNIHKTVLLTVQNNNLEEQLNWTNYMGIPVKSYSVYKSEDGGPQFLVNSAGLDSAYSDSNVVCNHTFTYQIQAMLANGEISFSDSITVKSYDTVRPITGPILLATVVRTGIQDGRIELDWKPAIDKELAGYNIYRSEDGLYWSLVIGHWPGTSLIDTGLDTYNQPYYYKIQPVDSCGNIGNFTTYHETIHLKAQSDNGFNQLNWNGYVGWSVREYLVYRNGILIDTVANNVFSFKDTAVICQNVYQYLIKAIDSLNDTILSASNTDSARATNNIPPQKVYIKTVTVSSPNKAATISWTPSPSYDVKNYFIYRKSPTSGTMTFVDSTTNLSYIDSNHINVPPLGTGGLANEGDCYYVFARDHCGNQSDGSNEGCIIILSATNQQGYNQLTWNSYQDWYDGVQGYNVYENSDSTGWQLIGTTSPPAPLLKERGAFTDSKLGDSVINFCYQVEAIENPGQYNQLSRSTVVCIHQDATVFIPNSFTPYNQDGLNDLFGPQGAYIKDYSMKIYNRWGEQVYTSPQPSPGGEGVGWDGKFQGQYVQQGVYIYLITVTDYNGKQSYFKGTITMFE